jgi:hypothetical protein
MMSSGNIKFGGIGFDVACGKTCGKYAPMMWKTLLDRPKQFLQQNARAIDLTSFSTSYPQAFISYTSSAASNYFIFPQFPQGDRTKIIQ